MNDDHPHHNPERAAEKAVKHALLRLSIVAAVGTLLAIVVATAALLLTVVAAASSLELLHGWAWLLAFAYLLTGPAAGVAALRQRWRILRTPRPTPDVVVTWKHTWSDLTSRDAWLVRVGTAPLVPLAAVRLSALHVPTPLGVSLAALGWLSIDLLTVVTVPSRRRLGRILRLTHPWASGGYAR